MPKPKRFSQQFRDAVDKSQMSRYAIAKTIGISHASMSQFMTGGWLAQETADKLADLLGLRITTTKKQKGR